MLTTRSTCGPKLPLRRCGNMKIALKTKIGVDIVHHPAGGTIPQRTCPPHTRYYSLTMTSAQLLP
jgi:hypothetical protein